MDRKYPIVLYDGNLGELKENEDYIRPPLSSLLFEPSGFLNRVDSTISFVDGTLTFSIQPAATSYNIVIQGILFVKNSLESKVISDVEGKHYLYFDQDGVLQETTTFSEDIILKYAYIAAIYWDATNSKAIVFEDERHGAIMDGKTHIHWHITIGTGFESGLKLDNFVVDGDGSLDSHAQFSCDDGYIRDEDIRFFIEDDNPQNIYPILYAPIFYRTGANGYWRYDTITAFPVKSYVGGSNLLAWNEWTGATWQQTETTDLYFVLCFILATNDVVNPVIAIQGQAEYEDFTKAKAGIFNELAMILTDILPVEEYIVLGAVMYEVNATFTNSVKARVIKFDEQSNYLDFRGSTRADIISPRTTTSNIFQNTTFIGTVVFGNSITPDPIAANTNDYYPDGLEDANMLRLSSTGNYSITGLKAPDPAKNQMIFVVNVGTNNITVKNNSGLSLAANRFLIGADKNLQSNEGIMLIYDDVSLRWRASAINI